MEFIHDRPTTAANKEDQVTADPQHTTGDGEMKERSTRTGFGTAKCRLARGLVAFVGSMLIVIQVTACSRQASTPKQQAKPPEPKNQTYRTIGGGSVISLVSSDELEIREGGQNIVCKYTKQDGRLRVVVSALGTTTAKYFNMTPQGLVDEDGDVYYEPATYDKVMAQIELNRQLWAAVERDDASAVEDLLRRGAAVETRDENRTALVMAVEGSMTNAVAALLTHHADANQKVGSTGETPLWKAIASGNIVTTELLLKHGARPGDRRNDGATPLMLAAAVGGGWMGPQRKPEHDRIVSILCSAKVDLNVQDNDGYSALGWSLRSGTLEAAKILVAAGADRNTGKDTGHDAFTLSKNDKAKTDAIRTPDERKAREELFAQYSNLLVGVWRDENSVMTFKQDGTRTTKRDKDTRVEKGTWALNEDVLFTENYTATILELTDDSFVFRDSGGEWHAKRVPKEEIAAQQARIDNTRRLLLGAWRSEQDVTTFNADGTLLENGQPAGTWTFDNETIGLSNGREYRIVSLTDSSIVLERLSCSWDCTWRATRVR